MTTNLTRLLCTAAVATAVSSATVGVAAAADPPNPSVTTDGPNRTLAVHAHRTSGTYIPKGSSPTQTFPTTPPQAGDAFTFADDLIQNGTKVGTDSGRCTINATSSKYASCDVVLTFAGGTLHSAGDAPQSTGPYSVPITGGTGDYSGANGSAHIIPVGTATKYTDSDVTLTFASRGASPSPTPKATAASGASTAAPATSSSSSGTSGTQVTTVPQGAAATGTGSARTGNGWMLGLGGAGILAAAGLFAAARRSRHEAH